MSQAINEGKIFIHHIYSYFQKGDLILTTDIKEDEFQNKMSQFVEYNNLSLENQKYYLDYFIEKAKSK